MVERDSILGYCVTCPHAAELLNSLDNQRPQNDLTANLIPAVLASLGSSAVVKNCQGPVPDIAYGQPIEICGQQEGQMTVEDLRRMQANAGIENPWMNPRTEE